MKTKMVKRVFAAMLAASSVMAMSGVAMAAKKAPGSGKSHGASKTPAQYARKVMKLKKIKARGKGKSKKDKQFNQQEGCNICKNEQVNALRELDDVVSKSYAKEGVIATKITSSSPIENSDNLQLDIYNKPVETFDEPSGAIFDAYDEDTDKSRLWDITGVFYTAVMGKADMLSQDCCNDEFVLKTTNEIRSLKHTHLMHDLKDCREDQELELVNALISWAKSDNITVKRNIAVAIGDLAQGGFFDDLSREKEQDVFGALVNCFDRDPSIKPDVAWAFKRLVDRGFVNENENLEEVLRLQEILNDCKDSCDVEPYIDIDDHCDSDSRNYNESESVDLPSETPPNSIYIPRYYMPVPSSKIDIYNGDGDLMMKSLVSPADILSKEDDRCVVDITHQIRAFKLDGNLSNLKKCLLEERVRLANALVNWMKSRRVARKVNVMVAIVDLAENGFFDGFDQTQKLDIFRGIVRGVDGDYLYKSNVAWAFKRLVQAGFVAGNESSQEVLKLQEILSDFEKYADYEPDIGLDYSFHNDDDYDGLEF